MFLYRPIKSETYYFFRTILLPTGSLQNGTLAKAAEYNDPDLGDVDLDFASSTSLHGIGKIAAATHCFVKLFYVVACLTSLGFFIWQILVLFDAFLEYSPVTDISYVVSIYCMLKRVARKYR